MHTLDSGKAAGRAEMASLGAVSGLAIWALVEEAAKVITHPHAYLFLTSLVAGFIAVLLGISGPNRILRAAVPAMCLAAGAALLITWAGFRFETLEAFTNAGHPIVAWAIFLFIGTPFAAAWLHDRNSFLSYVCLFDVSWSIMVRYSAAWLFVGVFWAVYYLSDALLQIVGLTVLSDILKTDAVAYAITGGALGLGLSVVHEMREYLSPYLVLRLLRLLVPVLLLVVVVFIAAAVLQDPSDMFGNLSRAATLLVVALAMISLVSIAIDRGDADAVKAGWMRTATAALAVLIPLIAGLASYAIWVRVAQYGWTPSRLAAATAAFVVVVYAVLYAGAIVVGGGWMPRIRKANTGVAVMILLIAAAWLSPLLHAELVSTRSQVARVMEGRADPTQAALWELQYEWGHAGRAGLAQIASAKDPELPEFVKAIEAVQSAKTRRDVVVGAATDQDLALQSRLIGAMHIVPEDAQVTAEMLQDWPKYRLQSWADLCQTAAEPGCVMLLGEFQPSLSDSAGFLFLPKRGPRYDVYSVFQNGKGIAIGENVARFGVQEVTRMQVGRILDGRYEIAPSSRKSLWIGELEIFADF